jgi:hypothetical protein
MSTSIGAWGHGKLLDTVDEEEGLCSRSCSLNSRVAGTFFRGLHEAGEMVLSGRALVIATIFGRTRSSQGIFHSVSSANILCISTQR